MTQVPGPQRPSAVPVVPESPEGADSPPAGHTDLPESPARPAMQELMTKLETLTGTPIDPDGRFAEWLTGNVDGFVMALELLLADGWRPPAQVIETVEALEALPDGAIICNCHGTAAQKSDEVWEFPNEVGQWHSAAVDLPATVLRLPDAKADGDGRA